MKKFIKIGTVNLHVIYNLVGHTRLGFDLCHFI